MRETPTDNPTCKPTGTVTFLFTDIQGSTKLWERNPSAMSGALARHDEILQGAIEDHGGFVFKTVGDAFCAAFATAPDGLEAALEAQRALLTEEWSEAVGTLKVRMALHTGAAEERGGDYFGPPLNRVARLLSAGQGGQILLSLATQELVRDNLPDGADLRDLGERRLKDLFRPERVFQLVGPDLPASFPPLKTLDARANNLPAQPTPLVGREKELGEIAATLGREGVRLLTLTGPGGTGKTRLGLQTAAEMLDGYEDGSFFVALAPVTDPELVTSAIAGALGVVETGEQPLAQSLEDYLRAKELLLVLDNFEQVLEAGPLVGGLLAACPKLKVLATSRAPLGIYGEREYPVPPLGLPDPKRLPPIERLTQYEALRLFIERAQGVKPGFEVTSENAPAVAEICVRLDGLPLAIELAAARVKLLPPQKILERLGSRLKLLKGGARNLPERQQTLKGAIDWSHELLEDEERILFRRLSVFSGGCTLEAAETVCDAEGDPDMAVLEGVGSLVDKSLLRQEEGLEGEPRFSMLQTIREYALERLEESGEAEGTRQRHAEYFLAFAEEVEPKLKGSQQIEWFDRLEEEHDNFRAALSWSLELGETEMGLRLVGALMWLWGVRGYYGEGRLWAETALGKEGQTTAAARAKVLAWAARMAQQQGDFDRAEEACEQGLELLQQSGERGEAELYLRITLGGMVAWRGNPERAAETLEEGLALSREIRDKWWIGAFLNNLAIVAAARGDHTRNRELLKESLALFREIGDRYNISYGLLNLGQDALLAGDQERGVALLEESVEVFRELGSKWELASALALLGYAAQLADDLQRATALYEESLTLSREAGMKANIGECLEGLADIAGARGEAVRAARLYGAAEALREAVGYPLTAEDLALMEPYLAAARSQLDEAVWQRAWEEGRAMALEEAIAYALQKDSSA